MLQLIQNKLGRRFESQKNHVAPHAVGPARTARSRALNSYD